MPSEKTRYAFKSRETVNVLDDRHERLAFFSSLSAASNDTLKKLIEVAYTEMTASQRRKAFGDRIAECAWNALPGEKLVEKVEEFLAASNAGHYYAPFEINSKNFSDVPPETDEWFSKLADYLMASAALVSKNDCVNAIKAFELLYELVDSIDNGDEIVFADECGSWMIPLREAECVSAFICALAREKTPEEFAQAVIPILKRDSGQSFTLNAYDAAKQFASPEHMERLKSEIKAHSVRTSVCI